MSDKTLEGASGSNSYSDAQDIAEPYTGPDDNALRELAKTITRETAHSWTSQNQFENVFEGDVDPRLDPSSPDFNARAWAHNMNNLYLQDRETYPSGDLGVSFRNLSAHGVGVDANFQKTVGNVPLAGFWNLANMMSSNTGNNVDILKPMDGVVKPGELLVVLGRPGAGCSTFLRTMAAQTYGFQLGANSEVNYMGVPADEIAKHYRGDVTYCAESELHFPQMSVGDTLMFAARMKAPANRLPGISRIQYAQHMRDMIMATFGLSHTVNTLVGNDLIRGVSGGERKRVSIAELALCGSRIQCWDNSTRGLDSATALEFIRTIRTSADIFSVTGLVAVYQASEEMYDLFDKAIVLYEGYQIYFGPRDKARQFFYDMGWQPKPRQPTPDFLTSLSQASEREPRPGYENKVPRTAEEFHQRWIQSDLYQELSKEIDEFNSEHPLNGPSKEIYIKAHSARKDNSLPTSVAYTVSWSEQIKALCIRGFQRIKGDPTMPMTSIIGQTVLGIIIASMFYNLPKTTGSFFFRTSLLFFALLFNALGSMLEIFALYQARPVVHKHHQYALYHPAIDAVASIITELPVKFITTLVFNIPVYFLSNLRREPGNFFFYYLVGITSTLCMSHVFRTIGAVTNSFEEAMIPANCILSALILFTGFVIPTQRMHKWCRWINYLDPIAYAYEALVANEFHHGEYECASFIPSGTGYENVTGDNRICSIAGALPGQELISGDRYIEVSFRYKWDHAWRNWGIIVGFTIFFLFTYMVLVWLNPGIVTKGEVLIYPRSVLRKRLAHTRQADVETVEKTNPFASEEDAHAEEQLIEASSDIFYWKDLVYDITIKKETRRILNYVDGWVKPGTLTALMGASGAGKTTLLDTLANRVTMGEVQGHIYVNGIPRDGSFQRSTGYAMQQDVHLSTATVRESLVFSALLRQSHDTPVAEKLQYVENVLKILEMDTYADAVVGVPGEGLNVEQRKRLTIGVEMAAKPKLLLFLDEPTSGLDSQTSWSICQLLRKLSNAGQAILCTIHQPSALLLQQFDRLLFLAKGGRTVYFGDIGPNSSTLTGYFEKYGADPIAPDANPAEWMLHVIGAAPGSHAKHDYADVWLHSEERLAIRQEIDHMMERFGAKHDNVSSDPNHNREFAAPMSVQAYLAIKRTFQFQWRSPTYIYSKLGLSIFSSLLNGFTFYRADNTMQGLQNLMFSIFMITLLSQSIIQQTLPTFAYQRAQYETRERPSKIFSWQAFIFAQVGAEVPWQIFTSVLSFLCWYYPAGLYRNARYTDTVTERSGLAFFYMMLFYLYASTLGYLLCAGMSDADSAANTAVMLFTLCLMFSGILVTQHALPGFWIFMYRISPFTYWIGGLLATGVGNAPVVCATYELLSIVPLSGMTCAEYLGPYLQANGGYIQDPNSTTDCQVCTMSSTNSYLESIGAPYRHRWRNVFIFMCYIFINFFGAIFFYWLGRVPKSASRVKNVKDPVPGEDPALDEASNPEENYDEIVADVEDHGGPTSLQRQRTREAHIAESEFEKGGYKNSS